MSRCFCNYKSVKRILQIRPWLAGTEMQLDQLKRDELLRSAVSLLQMRADALLISLDSLFTSRVEELAAFPGD